jgi:hypothetical protein
MKEIRHEKVIRVAVASLFACIALTPIPAKASRCEDLARLTLPAVTITNIDEHISGSI